MRTLYHHPLSTQSRLVRLAMNEKHLVADEREEPYWLRRGDLLSLNPSGDVPVLVEEDGEIICGGRVICEYLEDESPEVSLLGATPKARAETRRLVDWFDSKFCTEVTQFLAGEKLYKRVALGEVPDSRAMRAGRENIHAHLEYIAWLTDRRSWLAGDALSLADLAAGAHISLVDYTADVPWSDHPLAKEWYVRLKSRPSFRPLLSEMFPGVAPAAVYADLDF
ncbi:MAG: glutathione S-transferase family protein [Rhodospirillaceae bacterium]|jgi:glutathione S-transferase|nr:glutathione S-transferase family protein [Rhodospirillaceae bacterium]MBT5239137.1 glutathione S-transferase family protein [Rhodospirillaceae bacterium]MBT5564852.1 glutathione S-transferase family protein [Rhodospirillaceae bacterium]MBT6089184.1 glutathione S-transferase family protein [Rhodospirillaceae bacterium]MBT7450761.1 glutathione S-transferase family protein [Rhodospirillaceae bacterium]